MRPITLSCVFLLLSRSLHFASLQRTAMIRPNTINSFLLFSLQLILESEMDKAKDEKGVVGSEFPRQHSNHPDRSSSSLSNRSNIDVRICSIFQLLGLSEIPKFKAIRKDLYAWTLLHLFYPREHLIKYWGCIQARFNPISCHPFREEENLRVTDGFLGTLSI